MPEPDPWAQYLPWQPESAPVEPPSPWPGRARLVVGFLRRGAVGFVTMAGLHLAILSGMALAANRHDVAAWLTLPIGVVLGVALFGWAVREQFRRP